MKTIEELEALLERATAGQWSFGLSGLDQRIVLGGPGNKYVCSVQIKQTGGGYVALLMEQEREANAALIVAMHSALPALLQIVRAAEKVVGADGMHQRNVTINRLAAALIALKGKSDA